MSAPKRRKRPSDPFQPSTNEERAPELAFDPRAPRATAEMEAPLDEAADLPERRAPLKYRRPGVSWVTVVVLGFAAVGIAAVAGTALKKVGRMALQPATAARSTPPASTVYHELAKDSAALVSIQVTPRDARLMLDGEPLASNPVRLARGAHKIAATADGFAPLVQELNVDGPKTVRLKLKRARP
jgi:hypothetical protein